MVRWCSVNFQCRGVLLISSGWSGGAKVLGKLAVPGRPTIWMIVGQGPIALAVGACVVWLDIFTLLYLFSPLPPSLRETARYRMKYCLKGPLNPKQPTKNMLISIVVGHGPVAFAVGAGRGCLDICSLVYHLSLLSPSLWETARYRLKYCLKGPLSPKQPINQSLLALSANPRVGRDFCLHQRPMIDSVFSCTPDKDIPPMLSHHRPDKTHVNFMHWFYRKSLSTSSSGVSFLQLIKSKMVSV